jgi:hypothetical protein
MDEKMNNIQTSFNRPDIEQYIPLRKLKERTGTK